MGRRRAYLLVVLACCLLANGLYADLLVPEGEYRFEATPVGETPEARLDALADAGTLARLPAGAGWDRILESATRTDGPYREAEGRLPEGGDRLLSGRTRYASVAGTVYLVDATAEDGTVTLSAARTTPERALGAVAAPVMRLSGPHARALAEGSVETRLRTSHRDRLVRTADGYVLVTVTPVAPYDGPLELLPVALYPVGYAVLLWGLLSHPSLPSNYTIAPASKG